MNTEKLVRLAISDKGFVFDPQTGESYTVNEVGQHILKAMVNGVSEKDIANSICNEFNVEMDEAKRDLKDFIHQLKVTLML